MKELILLVGQATLPLDSKTFGMPENSEPDVDQSNSPPQGVVRMAAHWNHWDVPKGHISLPARLYAQLGEIRAEHMAWAYELGRSTVGRCDVAEHLKAGASLSMWWCSLLYERHPKMSPQLYTVYKLRALERLMDEQGFRSLRLCGGDALLRQTLADFCSASGRLFAEFHEPGLSQIQSQSLLRRIYGACPAPVRALARYAHWWWTIRRKLPPVPKGQPLPPAQGQAATIATYYPNVDMHAVSQGRFRSRYWESLHDALNAAAQSGDQNGPQNKPDAQNSQADGHFVRWLFIRFPAPQLKLSQCIKLRDRLRQECKDGASFHYLEEFLHHSDLWAALGRHLRLSLASQRLARRVRPLFCFAGSKLNFWPYLGRDWVESFQGWRGLERCLQERGLQDYVRSAGPQRWTLFPLENCPWERMLTDAVHTAGHGPVFGAQHSAIRPTDFRYFDDPRTFSDQECARFQPDAVRANGAGPCAQWQAAGLPPERLGQVEALRYLYLAGLEAAPVQPESSDPATAEEQPASMAVTRRLLVVTSFFNDETEAHLALLARSLHAGLLDGWDIVVKPHPYLPVQERLRALLGRRATAVRLADGAIAEQLTPGVLVWSSNSTTVALEAALQGLPVMAMLPDDDFDLCPLQDVPGLARTGSLEDVRHGLAQAAPLNLPQGYLNLNPALPLWKALLGL